MHRTGSSLPDSEAEGLPDADDRRAFSLTHSANLFAGYAWKAPCCIPLTQAAVLQC